MERLLDLVLVLIGCLYLMIISDKLVLLMPQFVIDYLLASFPLSLSLELRVYLVLSVNATLVVLVQEYESLLELVEVRHRLYLQVRCSRPLLQIRY